MVKIITGRERTKYLKTYLKSVFRQPLTYHRFWFVKTNIHSQNHLVVMLIIYNIYAIYIIYMHNVARMVGENWDSSDCRVPTKYSGVPSWARVPLVHHS
jgi:hypothetical protein